MSGSVCQKFGLMCKDIVRDCVRSSFCVTVYVSFALYKSAVQESQSGCITVAFHECQKWNVSSPARIRTSQRQCDIIDIYSTN